MLSNNIKELRKQNRISQMELAKKLNTTQANISAWESGKWQPDSENLIKMSHIFGVTVDYLLGNDEQKQLKIKKGIKIPVLGRIPAGIPIEAIQEIIDYEEIPEEMAKNGEYFALKVKGNSMSPEITDGEIAIVRKQFDADNGNICVVMVNGDEATLKRIKKSEQGLTLIPTNTIEFSPTFYTNKEIENLPVRILGKVVETRKTW